MCSIHHLTRYIQKLAQTTAALPPLLKTTETLNHSTGNQSKTQPSITSTL